MIREATSPPQPHYGCILASTSLTKKIRDFSRQGLKRCEVSPAAVQLLAGQRAEEMLPFMEPPRGSTGGGHASPTAPRAATFLSKYVDLMLPGAVYTLITCVPFTSRKAPILPTPVWKGGSNPFQMPNVTAITSVFSWALSPNRASHLFF